MPWQQGWHTNGTLRKQSTKPDFVKDSNLETAFNFGYCVPVERGHDDPAVEPLVAAVAEDEAQDARPARRDRRQPEELLL